MIRFAPHEIATTETKAAPTTSQPRASHLSRARWPSFEARAADVAAPSLLEYLLADATTPLNVERRPILRQHQELNDRHRIQYPDAVVTPTDIP